ncbi:MAG: hypothetical protein WCB96_07410 [Candidatus Aminicenantales bacterium]
MKKKRAVSIRLIAVGALAASFAGTGKEYRIDMRVFEIPPVAELY